jgi:2-amino-4-hydroxy-6-hydroxymethyldihydropteridine diphosphokinase
VSSYHSAAPVDVPDDQPDFLNAAVTGSTILGAWALLDRLLAIERERGRERPHRHAARTLDLDLVLYGDAIIGQPGLTVPHPHFRERVFVLAPLAEIAGEWRDPVTGKSVAELAAGLSTSTHG